MVWKRFDFLLYRPWPRAAAVLAGCILGLPAGAHAAQATLAADAHVNSAMPAVNSGAISNLDVGGGYTALLQFDLSMLPPGTSAAQVSRAVLRVYANRVTTPGLVTVAPISSAWGEYSVTYATEPAIGAPVGVVSINQAGAIVAIDVTSMVQGWITSPAANNGVALSAGSAVVQFDSKENDETAHPATLEIDLANSGPTGATGAPGAQGLVGPAGAQGPAGLAGAQGPVGPTGVQGPAGLTGATGAAGPQGLQGPSGPPGPSGAAGAQGPQGLPGSAGLNGLQGAQGLQGLQGQQGLQGIAGAAGAQGIPGPTGAPGATGPQGPAGAAGTPGAAGAQGPVGPAGANGMSYRGAWVASAGYVVNDAVSLNGATYIAQSANTANAPNLYPQTWAVLAQAGGAGPAGPTGPSGAAATFAIGTVTTGAAGTQAAVTNTGSSANAILNFTIPQGAAGSSGGSGGSTTSGVLSIYHDVSYANLFFSIGSATSSPGELAPVLTWVPAGCTATALNVYSQQSNPITVTLRSGVPGSMANTTLACTASTAVACSATGNVAIAAGSFVDLNITGASGTVAGVWTSLACN